jgi:TonB family protein
LVRGEQRRRTREQEARTMHEIFGESDPAANHDWARIRPMLDAALAELGEADREAVLLRFFEGRDFAGVGERLRLNENAARMRVGRALDKLHAALARRGITSTTAALGVALASQAVVAAPAGLAATVTGGALAGVAATSGAWATFMTMTKLQVGIASVLAVAGTTGFVLQARTNTGLQSELAGLRQQNAEIAALQTENARLARTAAEVESLRKDDAELARLGGEVAGLKETLSRVQPLAAEGGGPGGDTYDVAKLDQAPRVKSQARPMYPAEMRKQGIAGEVLVEFIVTKDGAVVNAVAARSTRAEFEAAAIEAVGRWTFDAGLKGGRQVNTRMQVTIAFRPPATDGAPGAPEIKG